MKTKLRTAVIGVGNMGMNHARIYSEISNLTAVCDLNINLAKKVANKFSCTAYDNYKDMLEKEKIDAISIVVPTKHHFNVALDCLNKKIPLLIEKPIATTVAEANKILNLAKQHKVPVLIGHLERFNPAVLKAKQLIDDNDLGQITNIIARRVGGSPQQPIQVDIVSDLAIHDVDIINFLLDELPRKVSINTISAGNNSVGNKSLANNADLYLQYKNASAYIHTNWITPVKIRQLAITGSDGYMELDYLTQKVKFFRSLDNEYQSSSKDFTQFIDKFSKDKDKIIKVVKKEPLKEELAFFLKAVKNNLIIDSQHAIDALKITTQK